MTKNNFEINTSRQFVAWMAEQNISIGFSTYQSGKVFLLGHQNEQNQLGLSVFERTFERPMGMWSNGDLLILSSLYQIYRFKNTLEDSQLADGYDRLFIPQSSSITGDLDIHDIALNKNGEIRFVNTLFGCLATDSIDYSFKPLWKPNFIHPMMPEDRCHLNGLAMENGEPRYMTAISTSNVVDGWREHRKNGGVVFDLKTNQIICRGLSMPHSPRIYNGLCWLANSGTGEFGYIENGKFKAVAFCPGYIRGVAIVNHYALVGLSKPRNKSFQGLDLDQRLATEKIEPRCGIYVIDLKTGATPHWLHLSGIVSELYDVVTFPQCKRPSMIGFKNDQIRRTLSIEPTDF